MYVVDVKNLEVSQLGHGNIEVRVSVYGDTQHWDDAYITESW
jgi:hypothetical protein